MAKTMARNNIELISYLQDELGDRFDYDLLALLSGGVYGTVDKIPFYITFMPNDFLLISFPPIGKEVEEELIPILNRVMGDAQPICKYILQNEGQELEKAMPTIEWDIVNPDDRISNLVNGRAFHGESNIIDLELFNGRDIDSYKETQPRNR